MNLGKVFEYWVRECILEGSFQKEELQNDPALVFSNFAEYVQSLEPEREINVLKEICKTVLDDPKIWEQGKYESRKRRSRV